MPKMRAPQSGVNVRMYRTGHGDCFLLAFPDQNNNPFYLLIDCGYQAGSEVRHRIDDIVRDIGESTGNHLHAVLITHEHEDHVNGFWSPAGGRFDGITVDQLWLAWTEDPADDVANDLRRRYKDTLLGLMAAQEQLRAAPEREIVQIAERMESLLALEIEGGCGARKPADREALLALKGEENKRAIKYIKDRTGRTPLYLRPDERQPYSLPGVPGVAVYALGPPREEKWLLSLNPQGAEGYAKLAALTGDTQSFLAAAVAHSQQAAPSRWRRTVDDAEQPFSVRFRIAEGQVGKGPYADFFRTHYGTKNQGRKESWRRIDHDWLRTAETLALRLNDEVNNTCLVVAIELPRTKKVLLFAGDAQRGNWVSWDDQSWIGPGGAEIKAKALLGRTVLYKVGHHGSHNATLKGSASSNYPNLGWMAQGDYQNEFVAMIPANPAWAARVHWTHPLPSIEQALSRKAKGRVFRTDVNHVPRSRDLTASEWQLFQSRTRETSLYFQYWIPD